MNSPERFAAGGRIVAWALVAVVAFAAPVSATGLRVLAYNTAFVSGSIHGPFSVPLLTIDFNERRFGMGYEERAEKIAQAVLGSGEEIVVFNEVFSEDARRILIGRLAPTYRSYVSRVKAAPDVEIPGVAAVDSGLMLFSRFPFVPFSVEASPPREMEVDGRNDGAPLGRSPRSVASVRFACAWVERNLVGIEFRAPTSDCLASKGAALVRIQTGSGSASLVDLVFTHLQASYKEMDTAESSVRDEQLRHVRRLIQASLTHRELTSGDHRVLLVGDLNVHGDNSPSLPPPSPEWSRQFDSPDNASAGFFACGKEPCDSSDPVAGSGGLQDGWAFGMSPVDPGFTSDNGDSRLDYVLHNAAPKSCLQYLSIAYDLHETNGGSPLSDHLALRADFNRTAPRCTPRRAVGVRLGNDPHAPTVRSFGPTDGSRIAFGGSMQWYLVEDAGDYSIHVDNDRIGFLVYEADDLSRPVSANSGEMTEWGSLYSLQQPPYYVRVFAVDPGTSEPDREFVGDYTVDFRKRN